jgi:hypothetical protein
VPSVAVAVRLAPLRVEATFSWSPGWWEAMSDASTSADDDVHDAHGDQGRGRFLGRSWDPTLMSP